MMLLPVFLRCHSRESLETLREVGVVFVAQAEGNLLDGVLRGEQPEFGRLHAPLQHVGFGCLARGLTEDADEMVA